MLGGPSSASRLWWTVGKLKPQINGGGPKMVKCIDRHCQIHFQKGSINSQATDKLQNCHFEFTYLTNLGWCDFIIIKSVGSCFTLFYYPRGHFSKCTFTSGISFGKVECVYELGGYSGGWIQPFKLKSKT